MDNRDTYLTGIVDQLGAAVAAGDPDRASAIVDQVHDDGHPAAARILDEALASTSLGPKMAEEPFATDVIVADATRTATERLAAISRWVDESPANAARNPETLTWIRVAKLAEETGECVDALNRATGANPRKTGGSMAEVSKELLDAALAALAAYEHTTGNSGYSLAALFAHIETTHQRAGLDGETCA